MAVVTIPEGRVAVPTQVGTTYRIVFPAPEELTAANLASAMGCVSTAVQPNIVRGFSLDEGNVDALIEVVEGGHLWSTATLRNRVIGAVDTCLSGETVIPPREYTYDPEAKTWTLDPLYIPETQQTGLGKWGGVLAIGGIVALVGYLALQPRKPVVPARLPKKLPASLAKTPLEKKVLSWLNKTGEDYDNGWVGAYDDLMQGGCQSGIVGELIYTKDTVAFYKKYKDEIKALVVEMMDDMGAKSPAELFGKDWDEEDPFVDGVDNQNLLAWFGFEETARRLADRAGYDG